jgi:hypothetical protein
VPDLYQAAARILSRGGSARGNAHGVRGSAGGRNSRRAQRPVGSPPVDQLEARVLFSVSTDANGWTVITPPKDARVIYVSSSTGSDSNPGTSSAKPLRTVAAGLSLLRDGAADQLLLERGDTFHESLGMWDKSGRSADEPLVIGAYGTGARPVLATGAGFGFETSGGAVEHVALIGLDFYADARDPASPTFRTSENVPGIQLMARGGDILIEDCAVRDYGTNIVVQSTHGPIHDVTIRRSAVLDAYCPTAHSEGIYAEGVQGLTLEENVFDHNGWNASVSGAVPTIFNHNAYLTNTTTGVVAHGNIFANASSHGMEARSGGDIQDNVFLDNPIGLDYGLVRGSPVTPGGVSGVVNGNVFLGTRDIDGAKRGIGMEVANTKPGVQTVVSNNIFSTDTDIGTGGDRSLAGTDGFPAIMLVYGSDLTNPDQAVGINDLTVQGNIVYKWTAGLSVQDGMQPGGSGLRALNHLQVINNDFQRIRSGPIVQHAAPLDPSQEDWRGGRYNGAGSDASLITVDGGGLSVSKWAQRIDPRGAEVRVNYADPDRTAATYSQSLGGANTDDAFVAGARALTSQNWDTRYTAAALVQDVRDGFAEPGQPARDWRAPTPPDSVATLPQSVTTADAGLTFSVSYTDDKAVDVASLSTAGVHLVGPNGYDEPATLVSVTGSGPGPVVATYTVPAPHTVWRRADRGTYTVTIDPGTVKDTDGFAFAGGRVGKAKLDVLKAPEPPVVKKLKVRGPAIRSLSAVFSADVSTTLAAGDLVLTAADGTTIDPSLMAVTWDAGHNTAKWTFPGLTGGALPAGIYRVSLKADLADPATGLHLDGNKDGLGGDDYVAAKAFHTR